MDEPTLTPIEGSVPEEESFKCGYMIALDREDKFVFETFGTEVGTVQLLGLNEIAKMKIHDPIEQKKFQKLYELMQNMMRVVTVALSMSNTPPPASPAPTE
jgi:hypothetical protein